MSRRPDQDRIAAARRAATLNRLISDGELPDRAEALIVAWEHQAAEEGLTPGAESWEAGWRWIFEQRFGRAPNWLDQWRSERPYLRENYSTLKARGAFAFTDSPEDERRAANNQSSEAEQEWHDYRHDVEAEFLERSTGTAARLGARTVRGRRPTLETP